MLYIVKYNIVYIIRYIIIPFFHISNSDQFSILIGGITRRNIVYIVRNNIVYMLLDIDRILCI